MSKAHVSVFGSGGDVLPIEEGEESQPVEFGNIAQSAVEEDNSLTISITNFTKAAGDNSAAVVKVWTQTSSPGCSVSYGGTPMDQVGSDFVVGGNDMVMSAFVLANPPSGAQTITVTQDSEPTKQYFVVESYINVDQSTPAGALFTNSGTGGTASIPVTDVGANDIVTDFIANWSGDDTTVGGAPQVERGTQEESFDVDKGQSTKTGSGTVTPSWSTPIADRWGHIGFRLIAA